MAAHGSKYEDEKRAGLLCRCDSLARRRIDGTVRQSSLTVSVVPTLIYVSTLRLNMPWPRVMDISHIAQMQVAELQKYAQDNRIQVIQLVRPEVDRLSSVGTSKVQNDQLYQILAKGLEQKGSVGIVKLPVSNRGIVIVALPSKCFCTEFICTSDSGFSCQTKASSLA